MTTIAAVIDRTNNIGYIAADTGAIVSGSTIVASRNKLIERDGYLIGTCGSTTFRAWQASQPPQTPAELWAGFFRYCREHGHGEASQGLWCGPDTAIFLTPDGLFVGLTSGVLEPVDEPFVAIGSGSAFATGALDVLWNSPRRPGVAAEYLHDAVMTACRRDPYTTGPVVLRSIKLNLEPNQERPMKRDDHSAETSEDFSTLEVRFGLSRDQRAKIAKALAQDADWRDIAYELGWDVETLKQHYRMDPTL